MLKGISDLSQPVDDPKRYLSNYGRNVTTSMNTYNSALRRSSGDCDATAHEASTRMVKLVSELQSISNTLPPRRDLIGNAVK